MAAKQSAPPTSGGAAPSGSLPARTATQATTAGNQTASAVKPVISASHTPTPAQQSPQVKRTLAPSLPEANPNAPKDPVQAMNERQRSAIESRLPKNRSAATESTSASTSAQTSTKPPEKPGSENTAPMEPAEKSSESSSKKPLESSDAQQPSSEDTSSQSSSKRGPRYEIKAMKKWAEENPEQAAEIRTHVFGFDPSSNEGYVKLQNKRRSIRKEIDEHRATSLAEIGARETAVKEHLGKVEATAKVIAPLMDLWEGGSRKDQQGNPMPDFDAVDAAFAQTTKGLDIDTYMRLRARRGVADPEKARLRAELARLKASQGAPATATPPETQASHLGQSNGAAAPAQTPAVPPPAEAAPKPAALADLTAKWSPEIPKDHKLRLIEGWAGKLDAEMAKYHDDQLDEYSRDPEEVAGVVLKRALAELAGEDEQEEAPAARPKPRPKPKPAATDRPRRASFAPPDHAELMRNPEALTPRQESQRARRVGTREGFEDYGSQDNPRDPLIRDRPERFGDRTQWAIVRAQARARGELVE